MTNRLSYLPALLTVLGLSAFALGCGGQVTELSGPQGNSPEAGVPGDPADASPSPDASAPDAPSEPEQKPCVDIHVSPELLGDPSRWDMDIKGDWNNIFAKDGRGVWVTDSTIYFFWAAAEKATSTDGNSAFRLIISAFDPRSGAHLKSVILPPMPKVECGAYVGPVAIDNAGNFLALFSDCPTIGPTRQRLIAGKLDGSAQARWIELHEASAGVIYDHLAWDGEAFVLHGLNITYPSPERSVMLLRLNADGSVRTPATELLTVTSYDWVDYRTQTETGRTLLLHGPDMLHQWMSLHERNGSLASGLDSSGWDSFPPSGVAQPASLMGFAPHGYFLELPHQGSHYFYQPFDEQFAPVQGPVEVSGLSRMGVPRNWQDTWYWVAQFDGIGVQSLGPSQQLQRTPLLEVAAQSCPQSSGWYLYDNAEIFRQKDNLWVGLWDYPPNVPCDQPHNKYFRILRVNEGCSYPARHPVHSHR